MADAMAGRVGCASPDADLVVLARMGSAAAYGALYRSHVKAVVGLVRARGSRDEHTVADIVQEVFTRALEHLDQLRDPERFGAWLLAIAEHVIVDHHRSANRSPVVEDDGEREAPSDGDAPDLVAEVHELARLVRRAVAGLAPRDAMAISLVSTLGLSSAELGAALGLTPGAAKVVLHRARRRLKGALRVQVLLQQRLGGCAELRGLVDAGAAVQDARHAEDCATCGEAEAHILDGPAVAALAPAARRFGVPDPAVARVRDA